MLMQFGNSAHPQSIMIEHPLTHPHEGGPLISHQEKLLAPKRAGHKATQDIYQR
jgi:hypothetical protein